MLWMSPGAGVALAHKTTTQPTNPAQYQYTEKLPTVHGTKHTAGRHKSTGTTTTSGGVTPTRHVGNKTTAKGVGATHHRRKHRRTRHHRKINTHAKPKPSASQRAHTLSPKGHGATGRLTAAVTTGSGGGISTWLLVILILVLVSGSAAGILRYRRNR